MATLQKAPIDHETIVKTCLNFHPTFTALVQTMQSRKLKEQT